MELAFSISARTARLIGMENFANAEGAIVELVKNSYDADADICVVVADIREKKEDSKLFIIDNGSGMTSETISRNWMTIGTNDKLNNAYSPKNRVKSGAKGIGRFALNRLGKKAEMLTFIESDNSKGLCWSVDWTLFEKADVLSDIKASLDDLSIDGFYSKLSDYSLDKLPIFAQLDIEHFHGTILCISDLNDIWSDGVLDSLLKNLEMLIPEHLSTFNIYLYKLQDLDWSGRVNPTEYSDYDYKVTATYSGGRTICTTVERNELNVSLLETMYLNVFNREAMKMAPFRLQDFHSRQFEKTIIINESIRDDLLTQVGDFSFTFYYIKNTTKDDADREGNKKFPYNAVDAKTRRHWLGKFGGVRIFRDGFRVRPYGENGNDWLELGRRQAQSPSGAGQKMGGYRIRPNQIAGVVSISRINNPLFEDKSSREGIQENDVFSLFKNLLLQVIAVFEYDRNYIMFNLSEQYKEEHPITTTAEAIANDTLNEKSKQGGSGPEGTDKLRILAEGYHALERELNDKEAELSMLRGLASMGISVATYTHELRSIMSRLMPRNDSLRSILLNHLPAERFENMRFGNPYNELSTMKEEDEKLYNWLNYSIHTIQRSKRDWVEINLSDYFKRFVESWRPSLAKQNIEIADDISKLGMAAIDAFEMDLDSVFNNFVTNSINAFLNSDEDRKTIKIKAINDHGLAVIDFIDNGKGLAAEYAGNPEVIFNAFETSTVDYKNNKVGTGMGLFIAKGVIEKFKDASITILPVDKGFGIRTIFKLK